MVAKRAPALGRLRTMSMMSSEHEINSTRLLDELAKQLPDESPLRIKSFNETHIECKPLGTGRFGDVFQYLNKQTNRFVAGKIVKMEMFNHYFQDWSKISLRVGVFLNELEILHKVSCEHERIANVTGIYSDYTQLIVFTEYLTNGSVKDILKDDKGLSEKTSLKYFYQICEALFYLHNQKIPIIHRDIKATNVLVDSFDNIKIANFGMVRDLAIDGFGIAVASEITVDFRGTMLYVAPEVLTSDLGPGNRNAYGKAADLWALGCTLIEMLVCYPPYYEYFGNVNINQREVLERAMGPVEKQLPYESKTLCPSATKHVKFLVDKLFEKDVGKRITVNELLKLKKQMDENINIQDISSLYSNLSSVPSYISLTSDKDESNKNENEKNNNTIEIEVVKDDQVSSKSLLLPAVSKKISNCNSSTKPSYHKHRKEPTLRNLAVCCAFFTSRLSLFFIFFLQSFGYTAMFVLLGLGILATFFIVAGSVIHGVRLVLSAYFGLDMSQPQFLIISGIFFILLFALLFSCCMVALGEYKFRMAHRTLKKSKHFVERPDHDLKIFGFTVVRKKKDEDDEDNDDMEAHTKEIFVKRSTYSNHSIINNYGNAPQINVTESDVQLSRIGSKDETKNELIDSFYYETPM